MLVDHSAFTKTMKVARWGNSLAVRLPVDLVKELGLKEGDRVGNDVLRFRKVIPKLTEAESLAAIDRLQAFIPENMSPEKWKIKHDDPEARG